MFKNNDGNPFSLSCHHCSGCIMRNMLFSHFKSRIHTQKKLIIILCPLKPVFKEFHSLDWCHI